MQPLVFRIIMSKYNTISTTASNNTTTTTNTPSSTMQSQLRQQKGGVVGMRRGPSEEVEEDVTAGKGC